jgi:hypothetical protein
VQGASASLRGAVRHPSPVALHPIVPMEKEEEWHDSIVSFSLSRSLLQRQ